MLNNKKKNAFTITELVIVIAVIAILAAVLIPTFSNVVEKANESKAMQAARSALDNYLVDALTEENMQSDNLLFVSGNYYFTYLNGEFNVTATELTDGATTVTIAGFNAITLGTNDVNQDDAYGKDVAIYELKATEAGA